MSSATRQIGLIDKPGQGKLDPATADFLITILIPDLANRTGQVAIRAVGARIATISRLRPKKITDPFEVTVLRFGTRRQFDQFARFRLWHFKS